jgi:hypothetical protein
MRSLVITIIALLLILPLASAATTIKLKTLPGHDVFISIWTEGLGSQVTSPKKYLSDINGEVTHVYEGSTSPFDVLVIVKAFDIQKYREEFGPYETGGVVQLPDLLPESYTPPVEEDDNSTGEESNEDNSTIANSTNEENNSSEENQEITGNGGFSFEFLSGDKAKTVYYVIGAIFIVAVVAVMVVYVLTRMKRSKPVQYGMEPVKLPEKPKHGSSGDKYLDSIEREIDDVERQIEQYKKRNRLEEAQKRLEEKKRILEKIKRGENIDYAKDSSKEDQKHKKRFY